MDLATAVGADRIVVGQYKIPRLTMRELAALTDLIRDERRAALIKSIQVNIKNCTTKLRKKV